MKLLPSVCLTSLCAVVVAPAAAGQAVPATEKIAPWVIERTAAGAEAEFLVVLADQADLSGAKALGTKAEKGRFVYDTLWRKAQETQAPLLAKLRALGVEHRPFYIVNALWVKGDRALVLDLASRADVARLDGNPRIHVDLPQPEPAVETEEPLAPGSNINYVRAPQVWALGFNGQGIVVGGQDTGYFWTHDALKPHYRGWDGVTADHNYNWHDSIHSIALPPSSCSADSSAPCDDNGHGTHTMGTAIGDDGATNQIGVAPGAKWIGCRNMDEGDGTPATYIECFEFFLAPYPLGSTPAFGDPSKAPDVTVNSWGCPPSEGCVANSLLAAVQAQRAAGILTEMSAGNSGSACSTVSDPAAIYDESFTTAALNSGTDIVAGFSSRGPVTVDGSNRMKPDIAAPGTDIRSSVRSGVSNYQSAGWSGTSMAGPHVAGGAAVVMSAFPSLIGNVNAIESLLASSALDIPMPLTTCSSVLGAVPNNYYGWGRLDLGCAVPAKVTGTAGICTGGNANLTADLVGTQPWTLTWSDAFVQAGVTSTPATRNVSPGATTTYTLTGVVNGVCNQAGAGSATITVHPDLSNVAINVVGSTSIGAPCQGGTATLTDTDGGANGHQWGFRTVSVSGPITDLPGETGPSYVLDCTDFPAPGVYWLVERTTPQCGGAMVSNEVMVSVSAVPVELMSFSVD